MSPATTPQSDPTRPHELAGRTFRMMRQAHGLGLRELAAFVGISPGHLSRIESGERAASGELHERICDVLASLPAPERAS